MVANNQNRQRSALARLKDRISESGLGAAHPILRPGYRPFIRVARAANDNRVPPAVLVYRALALGAVAALLAAAIF